MISVRPLSNEIPPLRRWLSPIIVSVLFHIITKMSIRQYRWGSPRDLKNKIAWRKRIMYGSNNDNAAGHVLERSAAYWKATSYIRPSLPSYNTVYPLQRLKFPLRETRFKIAHKRNVWKENTFSFAAVVTIATCNFCEGPTNRTLRILAYG